MFVIIGSVVVLACVIGGFLLEGGNIHVLFQPIELLIICGAALGSLIISAPPKLLKQVLSNLKGLVVTHTTSKKHYMEILSCLYQILAKIRKEGLISVEQDIEEPTKSSLFKAYPVVLHDEHLLQFICDNLKVITSTTIEPHRLDALMELDIDTHHHHAMEPSHSLTKVADSLPGLGIVAAVLGVVLTMGKLNEPPEVLGHSIGAALVGTFLGILMCYGFLGPMATNIEHRVNEEAIAYQVIRISLVAFINGSSPQIAVEFGRRAIPGHDRPGFAELEKHLRDRGK